MPQKPDDLSRIIQEIADRHAKQRGKGITKGALQRIGVIPPEFEAQPTINVDLAQLESMISDIVEIASKDSASTIEEGDMDSALKKVTCHYLWFC